MLRVVVQSHCHLSTIASLKATCMSQQSGKQVIECFGQPGSGKTTAAQSLVAADGYVLPPVHFSRFHKICLLLRNPRQVVRWVLFFTRGACMHRSARLLRYNIAVFFHTFASVHWVSLRSGGKYVVEEGLLQRLLSGSDVLLSEVQVERLLQAVERNEILWIRRTPESNRYTYAHIRTQLGDEYVTNWLHNLVANELVIMNVCQNNGYTIKQHSGEDGV